jgi:hypothetical protein
VVGSTKDMSCNCEVLTMKTHSPSSARFNISGLCLIAALGAGCTFDASQLRALPDATTDTGGRGVSTGTGGAESIGATGGAGGIVVVGGVTSAGGSGGVGGIGSGP